MQRPPQPTSGIAGIPHSSLFGVFFLRRSWPVDELCISLGRTSAKPSVTSAWSPFFRVKNSPVKPWSMSSFFCARMSSFAGYVVMFHNFKQTKTSRIGFYSSWGLGVKPKAPAPHLVLQPSELLHAVATLPQVVASYPRALGKGRGCPMYKSLISACNQLLGMIQADHWDDSHGQAILFQTNKNLVQSILHNRLNDSSIHKPKLLWIWPFPHP